MFDKDKKGFITILDVQRVLQVSCPCSCPSGSSLAEVQASEPSLCLCVQSISVQMDENTLHEILNEVDLNKNGQVELNEFLQVRAAFAASPASGKAPPQTADPAQGVLPLLRAGLAQGSVT